MKETIEDEKRVLLRIKNELKPLKKEESEARRLWALGNNKFISATKKLNERRKKGLTTDAIKDGVPNKAVQNLWETLEGWDQRSEDLTKRRDAAREAMRKKEEEIREQESLLAKVLHEHKIQLEQTDGVLDNVFMLNESVVSSLELMDRFLAAQVFPQLHEKGTQKTVENSQMTKRLVIMTNSINIMDVSKVVEAKGHIDAFFIRINPNTSIESKDDTVVMLSELLEELLDVKFRIKAGPNLSKFLALELSEEKFPELRKAQKLLVSATNYVRSGKYVRLYMRENKDAVWQPVRQS